MGLDMYLYKKLYANDDYEVTVKKNGQIKPIDLKYLIEEAGYWRKANHIHAWFVSNVQDGVDDCGTYPVSRAKLEELLDIVGMILADSKLVKGKVQNGSMVTDKGLEPIYEDGKYISNPELAKELLPTQKGFFFGSEDYDQWYYEDLQLTKDIIEKALRDPDATFEYTSSW